MKDYSKSLVYRLCHGGVTFYIGSTRTQLRKRKSKHKSNAKTGKRYKVYQYIREVGLDNFRIVQIEAYPCANRTELRIREQHFIEQAGTLFRCNLKNDDAAYCSPERSREQHRRYNHSEKGRIVERNRYPRRRVKIMCSCGCEVSKRNISTHRKTKIHQRLKPDL